MRKLKMRHHPLARGWGREEPNGRGGCRGERGIVTAAPKPIFIPIGDGNPHLGEHLGAAGYQKASTGRVATAAATGSPVSSAKPSGCQKNPTAGDGART